MSKRILIVAALYMSSSAAFAADLPSRRAPPVFVPPPLPVFTWTGAYIGGTAGYAFDSNHDILFAPTSVAARSDLANSRRPNAPGSVSEGFTGGGTIGYNFSTQDLPVLGGLANGFGGGAGLVFGVEADAAYTDVHRTQGFIGTTGLPSSVATRTQYVGTVRGRVGVAFDRLLVYGTGGFAYGGVRDAVVFYPTAAGGQDKIQTGYAYGGGVEYALPTASLVNVFNSSAVTIKAEYLHYNLGRGSFAVTGPGAASYTASDLVAGNLVRAGLNFKFGTPVAVPVVARY